MVTISPERVTLPNGWYWEPCKGYIPGFTLGHVFSKNDIQLFRFVWKSELTKVAEALQND